MRSADSNRRRSIGEFSNNCYLNWQEDDPPLRNWITIKIPLMSFARREKESRKRKLNLIRLNLSRLLLAKRNFCAASKNLSSNGALWLSPMDYHGIPLCNRSSSFRSSLVPFYQRSLRQSLVTSFLSRTRSSEAELISLTPSVAYNSPRVGEESILSPGVPASRHLLIRGLA